jgi:hypothetical protein
LKNGYGIPPARKAQREPIEIMKFAPTRLHEEVTNEEPHK